MSQVKFILSARFVGLLLIAFSTPGPLGAQPVAPTAVVAIVPMADNVSWSGFSRYWTGFVKNADRVLLVVGLIAAAALFIITRGKWL